MLWDVVLIIVFTDHRPTRMMDTKHDIESNGPPVKIAGLNEDATKAVLGDVNLVSNGGRDIVLIPAPSSDPRGR